MYSNALNHSSPSPATALPEPMLLCHHQLVVYTINKIIFLCFLNRDPCKGSRFRWIERNLSVSPIRDAGNNERRVAVPVDRSKTRQIFNILNSEPYLLLNFSGKRAFKYVIPVMFRILRKSEIILSL